MALPYEKPTIRDAVPTGVDGETPPLPQDLTAPHERRDRACVLVGEGNLLIECGLLLRQAGMRIVGVVSDDAAVADWACSLSLRTIGHGKDLVAWLMRSPFDYLLSIFNLQILPEEAIRLPRIAALNFHDGPLPRYAGLHAPSWALINGEKTYGVTWHVMEPTVDTGDIVRQRLFDVAFDETALSLNLKCLHAGLASLADLVPDLVRGTITATPQDPGRRTSYAGSRRPTAGGVLDWSRNGEESEALVRGVDFGPYFNPLVLPKIWTGQECLLASEMRLGDVVADAAPGTVLAMDDASLTIATASRPVVVAGLATVDGESLTVAEVADRCRLHVGDVLPVPQQDDAERLTSLSEALAVHERYWAGRLRSLLPVSLARSPRAARSAQAGPVVLQAWRVPEAVDSWLVRHGRRWQRHEFLLAAWGAFLARCSGCDSFDVEYAACGTRPAGDCGIFAERVPFRFDIGEDFAMVLEGVRQELARIERHRTYPRDLVPRSPELRRQSDLLRASKLKVAVDIGSVTGLAETGRDLVLRLPPVGREGVALVSHALHDEIPGLGAMFSTFIGNLVEAGTPLREIPLIDEQERRRLLGEWGSAAEADLSQDCLHHLVGSQAAATPEAVAVQCGAEEITYRELVARADRLAARLRRLGVGPEVPVGICVERSTDSVVGLLGILKAGGAYVPLDPAYPQSRLDFIVKDCRMGAIVSRRHLADRLPPGPTPREYLDEEPIHEPEQPAEPVAVTNRNLAYIIYTSGSTGEPKGVMVEHRSVVNFTRAAQARYALRPGDRVLQFASMNFDASVEEIFPCLCSGGTVVLRSDDMLSSARMFMQQCAAWRINVLDLPTAYWHVLVMQMQDGGLKPSPELRLVIIGGEAASPVHVDAWRKVAGARVALINTYGPTEATVVSTWADLDAGAVDGDVPIGLPVPGATVRVLDRSGQPVPVGVVGQLHIGGTVLARGYLNRPELTAERFVPDATGSVPGGRLYATGDLCRWRSDGVLVFHGRSDDQVKVRGHRIELGEIEAALLAVSGIRHAAVIAHELKAGDTRLIAYLAEGGGGVTDATIRQGLAGALPEFMMPAAFIRLESLPLNRNGKVDRTALPLPDLRRPAEIASVRPRTPLEERLASVWCKLLDVESIGVEDDFFASGGESLVAMELVAAIRQTWGVELPLRQLFERRTIASQAAFIASVAVLRDDSDGLRLDSAIRGRPIPIAAGAVTDMPATAAQQGMFLTQRLSVDPASYNEAIVFRTAAPVGGRRLRAAIAVLMNRHPALRTALLMGDDHLVQRISGPGVVDVPWSEATLPPADGVERERVIAELLCAEARRPFDLGRAPLWRVHLVREADGGEHTLLFVFHHSIIDDWSLRLFFEQLSILCSSPQDGTGFQASGSDAIFLPPALAETAADAHRAYWREELRDPPRGPRWLSDAPRPSVATGGGAWHWFTIDGETVGRLRALAAQEHVTFFTVMLAACHAWLHRISGDEDIIVGTPVADRRHPETQRLIGLFLNTLPIRLRWRDDPGGDDAGLGVRGFREVVVRVRDVFHAAMEHVALPFEQIVEVAARGRAADRHSLFRVLFALLEQPLPAVSLGGDAVLPEPVHTGTSKFELTLFAVVVAGELRCRIEYSTDVFDGATIGAYAEQLSMLLRNVAADPRKPLESISLSSPAERRRVTIDHNGSPEIPVPTACLHEWFDAQAARIPEAIALAWESGEWTYRELWTRARRLAVRLRRLGVGPDVPVGLCAARSPELLVGLLGILEAGGCCMPLDPGLPPSRLAFMLADSACPVVVVDRASADRIHGAHDEGSGRMTVVSLEDDAAEAAVADMPPAVSTNVDHLAYVLYTSGSTGQPKGVAMPHGPLVNLLAWQADQSFIGQGDRTLQFANPGFDVCFQEVFSTWLAGGTLVLVPDVVRQDPVALLRAVDRDGIARLFLPVVMLDQLAEAAEAIRLFPQALREVIVAGEQLRITPAIRRFFMQLVGCRLWNHYGPTETHVATAHLLSPDPAEWPDLPPIGRPIANTQAYVLDPHMQPVPRGVAGDIWIGGAAVSRGYWRRPELTTERFVADPFTGSPPRRLYRTGDRGRWRMDGQLDFLGRADHQVKIRGHRVELGEIESTLAGHADVQAAAAVVRAHDATHRSIVAFVVGRGPQEPRPVELRAWLQARLPEAMLPSRIVVLPSLPLNVNGKVDRPSLERLAAETARSEDPVVEAAAAAVREPPAGQHETMLASLWQSLLGVHGIARHDHFFALGGTSLLAMRLAARARDSLGVETAVRDVFEWPTLAALADRWKPRGSAAEKSPAPQAAAGRREVAATAAQERLWFLQQFAPDSPVYTIAAAHRIRGALDVAALRQSLDALMMRHESLRMTFSLDDGHVRALVGEDCRWPLETVSVEEMPPERREAAAGGRLVEAFRKPFVLDHGPLVRACLVRITADDHALILLMHHVVSDGWSMGVLHRELAAWYEAIVAGRPPSLPSCGMRESDIGGWLHRRLLGPQVAMQEAAAVRRLAGAPPHLELPTDRPRPAVESFRGGLVRRTLDQPLTERIVTLGRAEGCTPFVIVMAAFLESLARWARVDDVVVGVPMADRSHANVADVVGVLVNMLPVRVDLSGSPSARGLIARVREAVIEAMSQGDVPFDRLVDLLDVRRDAGRSPIFQVMCGWQDDTEEPLRLGNLAVESLPLDGGVSRYDLSLFAVRTAVGIELRLEYSSELFETATAQRLLGRIVHLLDQATSSPQAPVRLLSDGDRPLVVDAFNATSVGFGTARGIDELFRLQAGRTPSSSAVVADGETLTYAELAHRAGRVAAWLRGRGVADGSLVGLSLDRSPDAVAAMLGVLEAGAAYVPLDPDGPVERTALMLRDCGARIVLGRLPPGGDWPAEVVTIDLDAVLSAAGEPWDGGHGDADPGMRSAYVMYTSGSTGRPKGVVVHHEAVRNFLLAMQERWPLRPDDAVLLNTKTTFDISGYEIFGPLLCGARVVLAPAGPPDPRGLATFMATREITVAQFVPTMLGALVEQPAFAATRPLRLVFCGGEAMPQDLPRRFRQRSTARLVNMYGPTEATIWATAWPCGDVGADGPPPIGAPLANTRCYVLDDRMQPLPIGAVGELFIGGPQVALGYLDRPGLTAERFVADPFGRGADRLYRTGDLCSWRADGVLDFHGRIDDQVKIRGHRIEPGEIEAVLGSHPSLAEAAVVVCDRPRPGSGGDAVLRACVVLRPEHVLDVREARAWIAERLPEWMVPSEWLSVTALPLSPNGKIDRRAIAGMPLSEGMPGPRPREIDPPGEARSLLERQILGVWHRLFGRDDIGRSDHFFDIGGHSLLAARLAVELERLLGHPVPVATLFQWPTVESLARALANEEWLPPWAALVPLQPEGRRPPLFLVHGRGGSVYQFVEVARALAPDQPVYGLQAADIDERSHSDDTVPDMAARYVREIRSLQPEGPYHVGGYSLGGWIAYEVGRQLRAEGQEVTLFVFDTHANCRLPWLARGVALLGVMWFEIGWIADRCRHHAKRLAAVPRGRWFGYGLQKAGLAWRRILRTGVDRAATTGSVVGASINTPPNTIPASIVDRSVGRYFAADFTGSVELFVSQSRSAAMLPTMWRCLVKRRLRVHRLPCDHYDMFAGANLPRLAATLRQLVDRGGRPGSVTAPPERAS